MQDTSSTPPTLTENFNMKLRSTSPMSDVTAAHDASYSSLLLKKKLAMSENSTAAMKIESDMAHETNSSCIGVIRPSSMTLSINENEPVKSVGRRRKPLRPWSLSARVERPNSTIQSNNDHIEPISDTDDQSETKYSPISNNTTNSNVDEDSLTNEWPKQLSTIEEILKLYRVETNGSVECIRCGCKANQDNLLEHVSEHYPYKCYSCGFYTDSLSILDEHNQTHTSNHQSTEQQSVPVLTSNTTATKSSEPSNGTTNEKSTPASKTKVHRCRQCSFVSSVKEDYWAHHRVHIRADKILECPSCPFVTEYKHHLEYHLRNHLGSKPFKCSKCDYACVNLSMLRSHKKSHFRHLLFKCSNCSFESKQYQALQEHLQTEGHEAYVDENIEEFLKEYSSGNLSSLNLTSNNSNVLSSTPPTLVPNSTQKANARPSRSKKRKSMSNTSLPAHVKRTSSVSSNDSSAGALSSDEHQIDAASMSLACSLCDFVAVSKEGLGVHLFQHACKKSDLLNRSMLTNMSLDPTTKLLELFNGKIGPFATNTNGVSPQLNDFLGPYQQFLTQQLQSHLTSTSSNMHSYQLDSNNNHALPPAALLNGNYSLLSSCIKTDTNENIFPSAKRQRKDHSTDSDHSERNLNSIDQQTQVDEWQIKRLFECVHCEMIFKDFAMYCTHKQLHYSPENPFRCAQCGEQKTSKYDFFVHVAQQAHDLT
ncbi:unnamed protein product [Adineta ricciae]|uniref:C2H2-type domain-containing protein n=3 Tax=Adineta ricciae TaxID=249248 RepID=A0A813ZUZ8_ADIRI|nr:unnamed protein product [Adineta ricciae]